MKELVSKEISWKTSIDLLASNLFIFYKSAARGGGGGGWEGTLETSLFFYRPSEHFTRNPVSPFKPFTVVFRSPTPWTKELWRHQTPKCRLYWCLIEFIDCRYTQSCWYFRPSFVNWCPSNHLSGSTLLPPFPVWISTVYCIHVYSVWRGYGVLGLK